MELLTYVDIFLVACGMWNWICRMRDITLRDIAIPNPKSIPHQGRERIPRNLGPPTDDEPFRYEFAAPLGT